MKKKILYTLITALAFASCEKTVVVEPKAFISPAQALATISGLQSIMISAYDRMQDFGYYGNNYTLLGDVQADNIYTNTSITAGGNRFLGNNLNTIGTTYGHWGTSYLAINDCNLILANIDKVTATDAVKNQLKGEAYGIRALMYFDIARAYAWEPTLTAARGWDKGAVLRLLPSTDPISAGPIARSTVEQTYQQIEADFKQAVALCGPGSTAGLRTRMNKAAAAALLGRTYLYWGKFPEAVTQFDIAMSAASSNAVLAGPGQYASIFTSGRATSAGIESFFELTYNSTSEITGVTGANSTLYSYTHPSGYNGISTFGGQNVSDELMALITAANDDRKSLIFQSSGTGTATGTQYNWADKYTGKNTADGSFAYVDGIKIIRFADVLLMKAEALAEQGQYPAAAALVTQLHVARSNVQVVPTDVSIKDYIQTERRVELYYEGQRYFDLKRRGQPIVKPSKTSVGVIAADDYRLIAPLPLTEINNSTNLVVQNPKY